MLIPDDVLQEFQKAGYHSVKSRLSLGHFRSQKAKYAALYIADCDEQREAENIEREETRADQALTFSAEAVRIARHGRTIAIIAVIAALIASAASAVLAYFAATA